MRTIVVSTAWLVGCTVLGGLLLRQGFGDEFRIARYTGYLLPWLLVGAVPGAVWAWRTRARALAAILGVSGAMIAVAHVPAFERRDAVRSPSVLTLSIMSYNTWSRNGDEQKIARVVLRSAPDLVLFQEMPRRVFDRVVALLGDLYGGNAVYVAYEPTIQQAVVSRYPLSSSTAMKEKGQAQKVILGTPAGPIAVFNVHPLRDGGWRRRHDQLATLLEQDVLAEQGPVILGGDLNAPEHSQLYALVASHLENAQRAAGSAFGFTYPAAGMRLLGVVPAFPVVRIDHVFFSRHFTALHAEALRDSGGSDHRPVLAVLAMTAPSPGSGRSTASGDGGAE